MIILGIILGIYVISSLLTIMWLDNQAKRERAGLENRLMALTNPEALILHRAQEEPEPAGVSYVDESREVELNGA